MRFGLGIVGVFAAIVVHGASGGDFDRGNGPCHETPGNAFHATVEARDALGAKSQKTLALRVIGRG